MPSALTNSVWPSTSLEAALLWAVGGTLLYDADHARFDRTGDFYTRVVGHGDALSPAVILQLSLARFTLELRQARPWTHCCSRNVRLDSRRAFLRCWGCTTRIAGPCRTGIHSLMACERYGDSGGCFCGADEGRLYIESTGRASCRCQLHAGQAFSSCRGDQEELSWMAGSHEADSSPACFHVVRCGAT